MGLSPIHIFRPGRHTAMSGQTIEFTEADLQAAAAAYDPALHEAPIVVGHPQADAPAYGWVAALTYAEGALNAQPHQVDEAFAELVRAGRFKKVSASLYMPEAPNNPSPGHYYLRHVGFLGAAPPAIKGLKAAEFAADQEGVVELEFSEDAEGALWHQFTGWLKRHLNDDQAAFAEGLSLRPWHADPGAYRDAAAYCQASLVDLNAPGGAKTKGLCHLPVHEPGGALNRQALFAAQGALVGARGGVQLPEGAKRAAARKLVGLMRQHKLTPAASLIQVANFAEPDRQEVHVDTNEEQRREAAIAERERKIQAQEAAIAERERKIQAQEAQARREETARYVGTLVAQGKVLPRDQAGLIAFMDALPATELEFSEGTATVHKTPSDWVRAFLEHLPKAVEYDERARQSGDAPNSGAGGHSGAASVASDLPPGFAAAPEKLELRAKALAYAERNKVDFIQAVQAVERGAA